MHHLLLVLLLLVGQSSSLAAQADTLAGTVHDPDGRPIAEAALQVEGTLDGGMTDAQGRFRFEVTSPDTLRVSVRAIGFRPLAVVLVRPWPLPLRLQLDPLPTQLEELNAAAGSWKVGDEAGAVLTPLEVLRTPGATADVARAVQTLPGVQGVDEGTGLFVRGGDVTETRVLVNGALLLSPFRVQVPTGNVTSTVSPLLLDKVEFLAGGFGARYGNAASGVVALTTEGRPLAATTTLAASIGGAGLAFARPIGQEAGVRLSANYSDLRPLLAVWGEAQPFRPAPRGVDLSIGGHWSPRGAGEFTLFATGEVGRFGVGTPDGSVQTDYGNRSRGGLAALAWRHAPGPWTFSSTLGATHTGQDEAFGEAFALESRVTAWHLTQSVEWRGQRTVLRGGTELEAQRSRFVGALPSRQLSRPDDRTVVWRARPAFTRTGVFAEAGWQPVPALEVVAGARTDGTTLGPARTIDPRVRVAAVLGPLTLTGAWGIYRQVPDAALLAALPASTALPALLQSRHTVLGVQLGEGERLLRVEAYRKRYDQLLQLTPANSAMPGGRGRSQGVDLFAKTAVPGRINVRASLSLLDAERTVAGTDSLAPAPFDVPVTLILVADRQVGRVNVATAWRTATGRPETPVLGGRFDPAEQRIVPQLGAPFSERLPTFSRVDLSASWFRPRRGAGSLVLYVAVSNLLDRTNVIRWRYSADFTTRTPVRGPFNLSAFAGGSLTW